jgi:hypothetical protein
MKLHSYYYPAMCCGPLTALCVYFGTRNLWLALAVVCASLMICLYYLGLHRWLLRALAWRTELDHRKVSFPRPGVTKLNRRGCCTLLDLVIIIVCGHALLGVFYAIATGALAFH